MEDTETLMHLKNRKKRVGGKKKSMKKPQGTGDRVLHKVAGWVEYCVKCASGELT